MRLFILKQINKNMSIKALVTFVLLVGLFSFGFKGTVLAAGKPDGKGNIIGSICYFGGSVNKIQVVGIESERSACTGSGGTLVAVNQPMPAAACLVGNKVELWGPGKQGCENVGGKLLQVGDPLPAFWTPDSVYDANAAVADNNNSGSAATCSAQTLDDKAICTVAADCTEGTDSGNCQITKYLVIFINLLSAVVGVVVIASIVFGGIQYSMSAGDPQAVAAAKKRISNALLALVVFAVTYGFLQWIVPGGVL